jgi:glycosyltransferase 2 family protein
VPTSLATVDTVASQEVPPSLTGRFLNRRTILSLLVAALIVGLAIWRAPINWADAWNKIRHADPLLYIAALLIYYASFGVRAVRWRVLLKNTGEDRPTRALIGPLVTSFFVNCVVPAKMGDLYRAYQARARLAISGSKALGTIIAERLLDLCVLMALLLAAGAVVFHRKAPGVLIPYVIVGTLVCLAGVGVILTMRAGRGRRLLRLLPEAIFHRYESFRVGTVHSFGRFPTLVSLTVLVWFFEAARLGFVVFALNDGSLLGPSQFLLIALVAALLTTVPFLPGGLGLVEAGMVGVLIAVGGVSQQVAISIALLDRSISYGSLVVFGFIVFTATHLTAPRARPAAAQG